MQPQWTLIDELGDNGRFIGIGLIRCAVKVDAFDVNWPAGDAFQLASLTQFRPRN